MVLWALVLVNLFVAFPSWLNTGLYVTGAFLVIAHLVEFVAFQKTIAARPESPPAAFIMTFLFGVLYWKDFPSKPLDSE